MIQNKKYVQSKIVLLVKFASNKSVSALLGSRVNVRKQNESWGKRCSGKWHHCAAFHLNLLRSFHVCLQSNQEQQEAKPLGYSREEIFSSGKNGNIMLYRLI